MNKNQTVDELKKIQEESEKQDRPEQKTVTSLPANIRKKLNNLPDPTNPPLGYDDHKAYDKIFPYINIPALHPKNHGDTVLFNDLKSPPNKLYLGDNLEVLRTLKSESIDLIYIDPPFFSGRNYNVIWGDSNEVRTFGDIWEGGINSYLIWLNARLWEMRRVLKKTGSIYIHCDWHASHYIKTEMDKIFGYNNFKSEIIWKYFGPTSTKVNWPKKHDVILFYTKTNKYNFDASATLTEYDEKAVRRYDKVDENNKRYKLYPDGRKAYIKEGVANDVLEIPFVQGTSNERLGYPTQKPEALLERIIKASSNEGQVVADFFVGGGTTCAVAMRNKRKFIGCDTSRVAVSVTLDRLVKLGEEMSGVKSNISTDNEPYQFKLQTEGIVEKVPNMEVWYLGVYPVEKFKNLDQEEFNNFVLTAYGASRNTGRGIITGYKPPAQQEPILIGPSDPNQSIGAKEVKKFFEDVKTKVEPNKMIRAKIISWRFSRQIIAYVKILQKYIEKHNLPIELTAIPLESKEFRRRILQRMPDIGEAELFLRFSKPPVIGDIKIKKISKLDYEFEAADAFSTNEDGWLVNCQWDFDYQEGHFSANKEFVLSRKKKRDKKYGEIFEAILTAGHKFEKEGEFIVACKVQDNLAGETIISKRLSIS